MQSLAKLFILSSVLIISGCKDFDGVLTVNQDFAAKTKKAQITVQAGTYDSKLSFKSKEKAEIKLIFAGRGNDIVLPVKIPKSVKIPNNGKFQIKSAQSGQPFDISGEVQTVVERSETRRSHESCSVQEPYTECWSNRHGAQCRTVWRTRYGWADTEYYDRVTTQDLSVSIETQAGPVANLVGSNVERERIVTYSGRCW